VDTTWSGVGALKASDFCLAARLQCWLVSSCVPHSQSNHIQSEGSGPSCSMHLGSLAWAWVLCGMTGSLLGYCQSPGKNVIYSTHMTSTRNGQLVVYNVTSIGKHRKFIFKCQSYHLKNNSELSVKKCHSRQEDSFLLSWLSPYLQEQREINFSAVSDFSTSLYVLSDTMITTYKTTRYHNPEYNEWQKVKFLNTKTHVIF
jgi:hypothetical protein